MLKAIAIDDEPMALEVVKKLSEKVAFISLDDWFTDALKAVEYMRTQKVDLIFLDIKMPDISGIDFLKLVPYQPMVIFTTAYTEYAVQCFELDAVDYLLKPFSLPRFIKACTKAYELNELRAGAAKGTQSPRYIFIKSGYENIRLNLDDILYIESVGNYVQFVTQENIVTSRLTMNDLGQFMSTDEFVRVHRSFVVASKHITKFDKRSIWIMQHEIPVGQAYIEQTSKLRNRAG